MPKEEEMRLLKRRLSAQVLGRPGCSGVGVERDERGRDVLTVYLESDDPALKSRFPEKFEGHDVRYVVGGRFEKLPAREDKP
jgi:hypothetical protein